MKTCIGKYCEFTFCIFMVMLMIPHTATCQDSGWKLIKQENGISLYSREVSNSDYKEVKAVTHIKTSLSSLIALLKDIPSYPKWVNRCAYSKILEIINDTCHYGYVVTDSPWPLSDRDFVYEFAFCQDSITKIVTTKTTAKPNYIPHNENYIRITDAHSNWQLTPLESGLVEVIYQGIADPEINIPAWLVNTSIASSPIITMTNMKTEVLKPKYRDAKFGFINEQP